MRGRVHPRTGCAGHRAAGAGNCIRSSRVGATSRNAPPCAAHAFAFADVHQRHRADGMRGMRLPGGGIAHHSRLPWSAVTTSATVDARTAAVMSPIAASTASWRRASRRRGRRYGRPCRVGEVAHDQVEALRADRLDQLVGDFGDAHFRLQVVGRDQGARQPGCVPRPGTAPRARRRRRR